LGQTFGLFGGWASHRINGDGFAKGYWATLGAYSRIDRRSGFFEGSFSFGIGEYDLTRNIDLPGFSYDGANGHVHRADPRRAMATAQADTHDISARLASGRDLWRTNGWTIGPRGEVSLSHLTFKRYQETGAGSLNLVSDVYRTTYVEGGIGLFAGKRFRNFTATGKVMGMYGGVSGDDLSGNFQTFGSPYRVSGGYMSTAWVVPEAALAWNLVDGLSISGSYSGRFGERYSENTGSVGVNLHW
jgi:hypothetical protein